MGLNFMQANGTRERHQIKIALMMAMAEFRMQVVLIQVHVVRIIKVLLVVKIQASRVQV